jgi:hypothetical protein
MYKKVNEFIHYKKLPVLFLLTLCCSLANAQEFGARIGTSFSYFTNNFSLQNGGGPGLLIGGVVNYPLSDALGLTGGIDYHQIKGSVQNNPTAVGNALRIKDSNITVHAIEASALVGYKLPLTFLGDASPTVQGGLSIAYNVGTWDNYTARYIDGTSNFTLRGKENVGSLTKAWLPAWTIGLRFETELGEGLFSKMLIDFRLRSSFGDTLNVFPLNGSTEELGMKSISTSIGFIF